MIHYQCPSCKAIHTSPDLLAGLTVICKECRQAVEVPRESTVAKPSVEAAPIANQVERASPKAIPTAPVDERATPALAETAATPPPRPMMRWLILVLLVVLTPLFYLAWRLFMSS